MTLALGTPSRSFSSDAAGNIAADTDVATSKAFTWNGAGQLGEVKIGGVSKGTYAYDFLSRLVARQLPASSTVLHYVHDLDGNVIAEYDGAGALLGE
ncbi:MAG: hypothetical protein EOS65_23500 [Mesorhizobium sp.]|uniref:hypothetical protein n=1 Tax=Mesorhizobium sp. TaxID=1871066 RepID=UPI000FE510D5|nr:hypothetical protein [Mesorhizobium sp.]RWF38395.1 MAG: hypothetical protein EOS65_23500 [Mesorhizobium sp.]TIX16109.1 MAG: hypothetical protein E5V41_14240 [Mesorhizobium sp.]TJW08606.1 MAG: hypothetical protein E5W97_05140 [Mesorhizobium sp.]